METESAAGRNKRKLIIVLALTGSYMVIEVVAGFLTKSLALIADAGHMLTDAGSLALALLAIRFAEKPATAQKTYGYYRSEILAAFANAILLLFISAYILYEAWGRFRNPPEVMSGPMLAVATLGLLVNIASISLLHKGSGESLNVQGAYLEVLSDLLGSIGVIVASVIMLTTGWYLADPIISAGIGLFILPRTWKLLSEVAHILMEGAPSSIDLNLLESAMKKINGIEAIHDLHVWTITSGMNAMSSHIRVADVTETDRILQELRSMLKEKFQISHSTIQLEGKQCDDNIGV